MYFQITVSTLHVPHAWRFTRAANVAHASISWHEDVRTWGREDVRTRSIWRASRTDKPPNWDPRDSQLIEQRYICIWRLRCWYYWISLCYISEWWQKYKQTSFVARKFHNWITEQDFFPKYFFMRIQRFVNPRRTGGCRLARVGRNRFVLIHGVWGWIHHSLNCLNFNSISYVSTLVQ